MKTIYADAFRPQPLKKGLPPLLILFLLFLAPAHSTAQSRTDTMTLIDGARSMNYRYMQFIKMNSDTIYSIPFDSCLVKNKYEYLWAPDGPPIKIRDKYLNKRFRVSYVLDSIPMSENNVLGLVISKLVLIK